MSKDEDVKVLKIQTFILKVNIHCDGCKQKVKKLLQKIDGVYTSAIDAEKGTVTVSGDVDSDTLIKKLAKAGKPAELVSPKLPSINAGHLSNQFQKLQLNNGKVLGQKDGGKLTGGGAGNNQQKGHPTLAPPLMKGFKELNFPPLKDLKMPFGKGNPKSVKFSVPEDVSEDDDDFDDDDFDDDYDDVDCYDDDFEDHVKPVKMKPPFMVGPKKPTPVKKGSAAVNAPPLKLAPEPKNGAGKATDCKIGGGKNNPHGKLTGGGGSKNNNNNSHNSPIPAGNQQMSYPSMMASQMGSMNMPRGVMPGNMMMNMPPAGAGQGPPGFFPGGGAAITPEMFAAANPYQQQYLAAMMQQQQRMMHGQDRSFQQMPPYFPRAAPPVSHMPPPPEYTHFFSDENTNSCSVM